MKVRTQIAVKTANSGIKVILLADILYLKSEGRYTIINLKDNTSNFNQIIFSWNTSSVTDMQSMFENAVAFNQNISYWCVTNISSEPSKFSYNSPLIGNNKPVWGTCPVMPAANDDFGNPYLNTASNGIIEAADSTVAGVSYLLDGEIYIVVDDAGLAAAIGPNITNNIVTTKITDMSNLFQNNTTFNDDISNWDTSNVTNMREMFMGATALFAVDLIR
jgi:surface protein